MTKAYENMSPWEDKEQVDIIYMIGILGSDWKPEMTKVDIIASYETAMNPAEEIPGKMENI